MTLSHLKPTFIILFSLFFIFACGGSGTSTSPPVAVNIAPTANAGVDQSIALPTTVSLSGTGSDADGSVATYSWLQISGEVVTLSDASSSTTTFESPALLGEDTLVFTLTVTDDKGAKTEDTVSVTIAPVTLVSDITFSDANLSACVSDSAATNNWQFTYQVDALNCVDDNIVSLAGIENLTSMTMLTLERNQIVDIDALFKLTGLNEIWLSGNNNISCNYLDDLDLALPNAVISLPISCIPAPTPVVRNFTTFAAADLSVLSFDSDIVWAQDYDLEFSFASSSAQNQVIFGNEGDADWLRINANGTIQLAGASASSATSTLANNVDFDGKLHDYKVTRTGTEVEIFQDGLSMGVLSEAYAGDIRFDRAGQKNGVDFINGILADIRVRNTDIPLWLSSVRAPTASQIPTITESSTNQLTGSEYLASNTTVFSFLGGPIIETLNTTNQTVVTAKNTLLGGATATDRVAQITAMEFETTTEAFELALQSANANASFKLIVDGLEVAQVDPNSTHVLIDYSAFASKNRHVRLEFRAYPWIHKIRVKEAEAIVKPVLSNPTSITVLGDSFTSGTGSPDTSKHDSFCGYMAKELGVTDYRCSGVRSSGWISTGSMGEPNLQDRIGADGVAADAYVIAMGLNDTDATITTEINATFDTIRSNNPTQPIYVLSSWGDGFGSQKRPNIDASIEAAIGSRVGFYYIPVWQESFTKSDGTHPDGPGHITLGAYIAAQIRLIQAPVLNMPLDEDFAAVTQANNIANANKATATNVSETEAYTYDEDSRRWIGNVSGNILAKP